MPYAVRQKKPVYVFVDDTFDIHDSKCRMSFLKGSLDKNETKGERSVVFIVEQPPTADGNLSELIDSGTNVHMLNHVLMFRTPDMKHAVERNTISHTP